MLQILHSIWHIFIIMVGIWQWKKYHVKGNYIDKNLQSGKKVKKNKNEKIKMESKKKKLKVDLVDIKNKRKKVVFPFSFFPNQLYVEK